MTFWHWILCNVQPLHAAHHWWRWRPMPAPVPLAGHCKLCQSWMALHWVSHWPRVGTYCWWEHSWNSSSLYNILLHVFLKKTFNCILYDCIHLTNNVFFYILCQATVWLDAFSMMSTWALLTVATLMKTLSSSLWTDLMATNSSILTTPPMGKLRHSMMLPSFHYLSLHHLMVNK